METERKEFNRRSFFAKSTILLGGIHAVSSETASATIADAADMSNGDTHLYCDESGVLGRDSVFVIGMLSMSSSTPHNRYIHQLRERHNFWTQLKYSSTDRFKTPFAVDLINYLLGDNGLQFSAYVITYEAVQFLKRYRLSLEDVYYLYYELLISNGTAPRANKILNLEIRNSIGNDRVLWKHLRNNISNLSTINILASSSDDLLQFADLLAGSIYGDVYLDSLRNLVKSQLLELLKSRLNVDSLLDKRLENTNGPFRVVVI